METHQRITPNLWFDRQAEEAVTFYIHVFKHSRIGMITRYGEEGKDIHGMPSGTVMTIQFFLEGQEFTALNGGPLFKFNEALSLIVYCDTQEEIDYYAKSLSGSPGEENMQCGWLKDKFGISWQVTPRILPKMFSDNNQERTNRVMHAMLQMKKLDIAALEKAYNGS